MYSVTGLCGGHDVSGQVTPLVGKIGTSLAEHRNSKRLHIRNLIEMGLFGAICC